MAIDKKRKKLNRKIKRQREANNHLWSHYIINNYETIGLETLSVKEFLEKKIEQFKASGCTLFS